MTNRRTGSGSRVNREHRESARTHHPETVCLYLPPLPADAVGVQLNGRYFERGEYERMREKGRTHFADVSHKIEARSLLWQMHRELTAGDPIPLDFNKWTEDAGIWLSKQIT